MMKYTHDQLCDIAVSWLQRSFSAKGPGCNLAIKEIGAYSPGEIADAWGFRYDRYVFGSVLVEVKVSRSDFLADANKPHRNGSELGVGTYRYYLCPEGVITLDELPHGWGLLWVNSRGHVKFMAGHVGLMLDGSTPLLPCWEHEVNKDRELMYLGHSLAKVSDLPSIVEMRRKNASLESKLLKAQCQVSSSEYNYREICRRHQRVMKWFHRFRRGLLG